MIKVIKTEEEYIKAISRINELLEMDLKPDSELATELEVLTILVGKYEDENIQISPPTPIEAIQFRMEQQKLKKRDLIPYIGSRSKVSEVLSEKRPLTISMIRALHEGLGIPAEILITEKKNQIEEIEWPNFPYKEMSIRGWLDGIYTVFNLKTENALKKFFQNEEAKLKPIFLYRQNLNIRSARSMDSYALMAWTNRIIYQAKKNPPKSKFQRTKTDWIKGLIELSINANGPFLAIEYLSKQGIAVIIEPHLSRTYLDGAAIILKDNYPIIGLTIRHDRLDNFWFTLMHELAHIMLHGNDDIHNFIDDLDLSENIDKKEVEADNYAIETLIPKNIWETSPASRLRSPEAAEHLAKKLNINPAIVAGKMRHEFKAYRLLNNLVGHKQVRKLFNNVSW